MYGVSKISSEQNIMLTTFPGAQYSAQSLAEHLDVFAKAGIVVDMICRIQGQSPAGLRRLQQDQPLW